MARSTVHYADSETNNILKKLHDKLRPAGTPVQRVEYIVELLMPCVLGSRWPTKDQPRESEQLRPVKSPPSCVQTLNCLLPPAVMTIGAL